MSKGTMTRLRDLGTWSGGNTPSKANPAYWTGGTVPWVSPKDMKVDEIVSSEDHITNIALDDGRVSLVPEGSVLFVTRSGILAHTFPVAITRLPVTINQDLKALSPKPGISPKYVAHAIRGASQRILKQCSKHGTTVASVETSALLDFEIPIVDLEAQHRIVAEIEKQFSRLDEAVAGLKRVKANLKRYKAAVLKAAVEGRLVPTEADLAHREGRSFETGAQLLQRILETRRSQWQGKGKYKEPAAPDTTDLPELPEGWVMSDGVQLFRWSSGVNLPVKNLVGGPIPVYGGNGVNGGHSEANVSHETVVIGRVGAGCGNVHLVDHPAWITDNAIYATWTPTNCSLPYLANVFSVANLNAVAAGSGQPFVNQTILNDVLVPLPPVAEQHRIVAEVDRLLSIAREAEAEVDANLKRAQALRQAILTRAFQPVAT